jgi:hypothetical protein
MHSRYPTISSVNMHLFITSQTNKHLGGAEVECGEDSLSMLWTTEAPFEGRVFVVNHVNESECVAKNYTGTSTNVAFTVSKDKCGVVTTRSVIYSSWIIK